MVDGQDLPEDAVDVPGEVDDAAGADLAQVHLGDVGLRDAGVDHLHRQVGVARDQRQRPVGELDAWA